VFFVSENAATPLQQQKQVDENVDPEGRLTAAEMEFPDLLELDNEVVPFTSPMPSVLQQIQNTRGRGRG
jgi:hypothetical protein